MSERVTFIRNFSWPISGTQTADYAEGKPYTVSDDVASAARAKGAVAPVLKKFDKPVRAHKGSGFSFMKMRGEPQG